MSFFGYSQQVGEIIPLTVRENFTVRGDMVVTGNSILGVRGIYNQVNYAPNDNYNQTNDNGALNFRDVDRFGNPTPIGTIFGYTRAYIDIDDDPAFNSIFSPTFLADSDNFRYGGSQNADGDGSPTSGSNIGTFSSSAANLDIDPNCGVVKKAFLYWTGLYPQETINTYRGRRFYDQGAPYFIVEGINPGSSNNPRNSFGPNPQSDYTEIKILPPGADQYYNISINPAAAPANPSGIQIQTEVIVDGLDGSFFNNQSEIDGENRLIAQRNRERSEARPPQPPLTPSEEALIRNNITVESISGNPYVCIADVTQLFTSLQAASMPVNGNWTVGNVRATTGYNRGLGLSGGWALMVIYENNTSTVTEKEITFFDGYAVIEGPPRGSPPGTPSPNVEIQTPNFTTIPEGPIKAWIASASVEGDRGLGGDQFFIRSQSTMLTPAPFDRAVLRENNPDDNRGNFFNSTITDLNGVNLNRFPASSNTLGIDIDHFKLTNTNNFVLNNEADNSPAGITDSNATLILTTNRDVYSNYFNAFAIEVIAADVRVLKEAINATTLATIPNNGAINFGDEIIYRLTINNVGNDDATQLTLTDYIPSNTRLLHYNTRSELMPTTPDSDLGDYFSFGSTLPAGFAPPTITRIRQDAPNSITNLPYETDRITITNLPIISRFDCAGSIPCESTTKTQEIIIEFRVRVVDECSPQRNSCYDQVSNLVEGTFNGTLSVRDTSAGESLFTLRSASEVDVTCNSLILGPTIQLPTRAARCTSEVGTICTGGTGGNTDIQASVGFEIYKLYFYPLAEISDGAGNIVDANGSGTVDDTDYPIDSTRLIRTQVLTGSNTANEPARLAALISPIVGATPEQFNVTGAGFYIIESINDEVSLPCSNGIETFSVGVFDTSLPINRPLEVPSLGGQIRNCSVGGGSTIVQFEICNGQLDIPTNYPAGTRIEWRKVNPSCTTPTSPNDCPVTGPAGCEYQIIRTNETIGTRPEAVGTTGSGISITETGDYSLTATLINGGCTETFFFKVIEFVNSTLTLSIPSTTKCNELPKVTVNGLPSHTSGGLQYRLEYTFNGGTPIVQTPPAPSDPVDPAYGELSIPRPATTPNTVAVQVIATPITSSPSFNLTSCRIVLNESIVFSVPEILKFEVSRAPSCNTDQSATTTADETKADLSVEVTENSEQYIYQLINTQGTTSVSDDVLIREAISNIRTNFDDFRNVDTGVEYKMRVFFNGEAPAPGDENRTVTQIVNDINSGPSPRNIVTCIQEQILAPIPEAPDFSATITPIKEINCQPGIIAINFTSDLTPNPTTMTFSIPALQLFGRPVPPPPAPPTPPGYLISIQDASLRPAIVPADNVGPGISQDPSDNVYYIDLSTVLDLDITVNLNATCFKIIEDFPIPLTRYEGLKVALDPAITPNPSSVSCKNNTDGNFTALATNLSDGALTAGSTLEYEIISFVTTTNTSAIFPVPVTQTNPFFSNLPAGDFQFIVRDITDPSNPCESLPETVTIIEPDPVGAVGIIQDGTYNCGEFGAITIDIADITTLFPGGTTDLGGTKPYTIFLFRGDGVTPITTATATPVFSPDPNPTPSAILTAATITDLPFTNLTTGVYQVRIRDANNCPLGALSNQIEFTPHSEVATFVEGASIPITCDGSNNVNPTTTVIVLATADNSGTITKYEVTAATLTPSDPVLEGAITGTTNTTGSFNLPVGTFTITATTNSSCTDTLEVTVDSIIRIDATRPVASTINCVGDLSSATSTISGTSSTGYTYELRLGTGAPIATNTSTTPVTGATVSLTNLVPSGSDMYIFTVTDAVTGCTDEEMFTVAPAPTPPTVTIDNTPEYACTGTNVGTYTFSVQGANGTGTGYTFSINSPFVVPVNPDGTSFTVAVPTTGSITYQVAVRDSNSCPGTTTLPVTVNSIEGFTATLNTASNLCLPNTSTDPNLNILIDVTGTPNFRYQQILNGSNVGGQVDVTTITGNSGQIDIDLPTPATNVTNNYEFVIFDDNHDIGACQIRIPVTINPIIEVSAPNRVNPTCDIASGALPTDGATVNFTVTGGTGTYAYEVFNTTPATEVDITSAVGVTQTGTATNPTFSFSDAFDGQNIEVRIVDNATPACEAPSAVTFTPMYPRLPIVLSETLVPAKCNGGPSTLTLNLDLTDGSVIGDYEYTFNGTTLTTNEFPNPPAGTLNYTVKRRSVTGTEPNRNCSVSGSVIIQEPSEISEVSRDQVPPRCNPIILGSIELVVQGGFINNPSVPIGTPFPTPGTQSDAVYDFVLNEVTVDISGAVVTTFIANQNGVTSSATGSTVNFNSLDAGTYTIQATLNDGDADTTNNCSQTFTFVLPREPIVNVINVQFNTATCSGAGVELYAVIDGGATPANFEMYIDRVNTIFIPPTPFPEPPATQTNSATDTDYIARYLDSDFPDEAIVPLPTGITIPTLSDFKDTPTFATDANPDARIRERFFRFTGLPPGGRYRIVVRDATTSCETVVDIPAPQPESIKVTAVKGTNTGFCNPPSGTAIVTFDIIGSDVNMASSALYGDYELQLQRIGSTDDTTERIVVEVVPPTTPLPLGPNQVTGTFVAGNPSAMPPTIDRIEGIEVTLEGLPEISVSENAVIRVSQVGSSCSNVSTQFTIERDDPIAGFMVGETAANCNGFAILTASATGGNGMYSYLVVREGTIPEPDALTVFPTPTTGPVTINIPVDETSPDPRITLAGPSPTPANLFGTVAVYVRSGGCTEGPLQAQILLDKSPELALGNISNECTVASTYTIDYTITNYDSTQNYNFTINGATITPVNNASLTVLPGTPIVAEGQLVVNDGRRIYNVSLAGSLHSSCISNASFRIYPELDATTTVGLVNCDDEFANVTAEVTGGYVGEVSRELFYELILESSGAVVASQTLTKTPSNTITEAVFTNGVGGLTLDADTAYDIRVTDRLDPSATSTVRSCTITRDIAEVSEIELPVFTLSTKQATCPTTPDGEIEFVISDAGDRIPVIPRLYRFDNISDANAAVAQATSPAKDYSLITAATLINNPSNDLEYENLESDPVAYVAYLETSTLGCPTVPQLQQLALPIVPSLSDFNITETTGTCNNVDRTDDALTLGIEVLAVNPTDAVLTYEITGPSFNQPQTDIVITGSTPFTVTGIPTLPASRTSALTYILRIRNRNQPTCNALERTITVPACPGIDPPLEPLTVNLVLDPLICNDDTAGTGTVTVSGKPTLDYSFTVTGGVSAPQSGTSTVGAFDLTGLEPDKTYTVSVLDRSDARATLVFSEPRSFTIPNALVITPGTAAITCNSNTPSVRVEYTVTEGNGPYEFTLTDALDVVLSGPITPPSNGNRQFFDYITDGSYKVKVSDRDSCDSEIAFLIDVPDAIAGTINVNNECLSIPASANPIEVQIDITSGQTPFRYRVFESSSTPGAFSGDISSTRIIDTSINTSGTYIFEIIDQNNCPFAFSPVTIVPPLTVANPNGVRVEPVCSSVSPPAMPQARTVGQITYSPTGGTPPYRYEVAKLNSSGADPTSLFVPFTTGFPFEVAEIDEDKFFIFRVTDNNNCTITLREFNFSFPETPVAGAIVTNIACKGDTGRITVQAPTVGVGPFTYAFFEGTSRPSPEPTNFFTNVTSVTSTTAKTFTYIVKDRNGCESMPEQETINDNSIQLGSINSTPVTCEIIPPAIVPTNDNGTVRLSILRGGPNFIYTIFDTATNTQVATATDDIDAADDGTATTPSRTITFGRLEVGRYEIRVSDATAGCAPVSFFREVRSASPVTVGPPVYSDCDSSGGGVIALFRISGATTPFIESAASGTGIPLDPSIPADDVFAYTDLSTAQQALIPFTPTAGTEGTYFAITGLASNTSYSLEIIDDVSKCNTVVNLRSDIDLVDITNVRIVNDSFCPPTGTPVEGRLIVDFEVRTSGAATFDVTLLDANDNIITLPTVLPNPRMGVTVIAGAGTQTFNGLPAGRYKVRVDEPGGICGDESAILELLQAPELQDPSVVSQTNASCVSFAGTAQLATVTVTASGGILFDPTTPTDTNGYLFALVEDGIIPTFVSETDATDDFFDQITFERDFAINPDWDLYVRDNSSCTLKGPIDVTIAINPEPTIASLASVFSNNQCNGPNFPIDVEVTNYDTTRAPYTFDILDSTGAAIVVANANTVNTGAVDGTSSVIIPNRGTFNIRVTDVNGCNVSETITIFDELEVIATTGSVECDGTLSGVTANVTGGFIAGTRTLRYDLLEQGVSTVLNTEVRPLATIATDSFTFIQDSSASPLRAGTTYFVRVTDDFGTIAPTPPICVGVSNTVRGVPVAKSIPRDIELVSEISCSGGSNASLRLRLQTSPAGDTPASPETFELYGFDTVLNADAFIATNPTAAPVSPGTTGYDGAGSALPRVGELNLFENLGAGVYVGFVINNGCYTVYPASQVIDAEPAYTPPAIIATGEAGSCTTTTTTSSFIRISVNDLNGVRPYFYRITPDGTTPSGAFVEIVETRPGATPIVPLQIDIPSINGDFQVEFIDSSITTCGYPDINGGATMLTVPVFNLPVTVAQRDTSATNGGAYSCTTNERVRVVVNGNPGERFTFEAIPLSGSPATISTNPQTGVIVPNTGTAEAEVFFEFSGVGTYEFVATNEASMCTDTSDVYEIEELDQLRVRLIGTPQVTCLGDTDQQISFAVEDFDGFITYQLLDSSGAVVYPVIGAGPGGTTPVTRIDPTVVPATEVRPPVLLGAGNYELIVTAVDGTGTSTSANTLCTTTLTAPIRDVAAPVMLSVAPAAPITCVDTSTTIQATATMGVPPYEYQLTGSVSGLIVGFTTDGNPTPNTTGFFGSAIPQLSTIQTFTIVAKDSTGCLTMPEMVTPEEFTTLPTLDSVVPVSPQCNNVNTGTITVAASSVDPRVTEFTFTLLKADDISGTVNLVEVSKVKTTGSHVFTVIAGDVATPAFYFVEVTDQFGCVPTTPRSLGQEIVKPTQVTFQEPDALRAITCINSQRTRINVSGGTGTITVELLARNTDGSRVFPITATATNNSPGLGNREFDIEPGVNYFRATDLNNCTAFYQVRGNNAPTDIEYEITPRQKDRVVLCFEDTDFVDVDGNVIGGVSGYGYSIHIAIPSGSVGGFTEIAPVVDETGTNVNVNVILQTARRDGVSRFENIRSLQTLIPGVYPSNATYVYKVTSGDCDVVYKPFEILEHSEIVPTIDITLPVCAGDDNAEVNISFPIKALPTDLDINDPGQYSITIIREEGGVFDVRKTGIGRLLNIGTTPSANRTVTISNLMVGNYQLLVTGNDCPLEPIPFIIDDKTPLVLNEIVADRIQPSCGEQNGSVRYSVTGGTPPYFYRILDLDKDTPDEVIFPEIDVWGDPVRVLTTSGDTFTVTTDQNGDLLKNNHRYQVVVVDSGNEKYDLAQAAATGTYVQDRNVDGDVVLRVCNEVSNAINFEVPDLTGFTFSEQFNCETSDYTVTVKLRDESTLIPENITYVLENTSEGTIALGERGNNIFNNVKGGNIEVTLRYINPLNLVVCDSNNLGVDSSGVEVGIVRKQLDVFIPLSIRREVDENGDQTGLPYELVGLNEYRVTAQGGSPDYKYEINNEATGGVIPVRTDLRGRAIFTIEDSGVFSVSVEDSNDCTVFLSAIRLNFIDITVPNVFNPAGGSETDSSIRRWYPESLTFGTAIEDFPKDGVLIEGGDIVFTITIEGTTTGGTPTGSQVTGGTTTGGITVITTIKPDGTTTVRQTTGGTVTGGTTTGGTITGDGSPGNPFVVTGGTTVGGIITGGVSGPEVPTNKTSTGGTTIITTTVGTSVTTGGTTEGGVTTGGTTTGGFTLQTTTTGTGDNIVTTVRIIENGTVTGGTRQGGLVTGGTLVPATGIITVPSLSVPSSQGDGERINPEDEFVDFSNIDVLVFDRYGRLLEQFKGIKDRSDGEGWDGTYQGNLMPTGDYWYLIKLNDRRGREFTGHFTLYRSKQ